MLTIPQPAHGVVFVQVRLKLGCVQCGNRSPIDMLDADGRYFCFSCQQDRQFDTDLWHERIVPMAAIVADGFWTNMRMLPPWPPVMPEEDWLEDQEGWSEIGEVIPQLMKDFLPRIGIERARLTMEQEGTVFGAGGMKTSTHEVALFPGYPLCTICKSPVQVGFPKRGVAQVGCLRCNVHETHVSSEELVAKCPDLIAAIAPDHVQGRPPVRTEAKAGTAALAVLCPQCGASLAMPTGTRTVTCTHCRATAIVPERLAATPGQTPDPEGWWLALYAPCSLRKLLSQPGAGRNKDDDDD